MKIEAIVRINSLMPAKSISRINKKSRFLKIQKNGGLQKKYVLSRDEYIAILYALKKYDTYVENKFSDNKEMSGESIDIMG